MSQKSPVPVENKITTLSVVKIAIKLSPCGLQFSTHFSITKTEEMKNHSTQFCSNLWKNEKRLFFHEFKISFALIYLQLETRIMRYICTTYYHIFYVQLFATIISSRNSLKFSDIYLNSRIHLLKMKIQFCQFQ